MVLGEQVTRIATSGAKVLLSTVPDLGLTPFGLAERAANTDTDRSALLTRLTARFNAKMRATIPNDGRMIGRPLHQRVERRAAPRWRSGG